MDESDPAGLARLWLSELGATVPEYHATDRTIAPRETQFGLHLSERDRARRHSRRLEQELLRVTRDAPPRR
jgi:hypothetical protein